MAWSFVAVLLFLALRIWAAPQAAAELPPAVAVHFVHFIGVGLALAIAVFADRLIRLFYWNGYLRRKRKQGTPALIEDIVTAALLVLGVSFGLFFEEGVSFTGLLTASGATAIILGIALQAVIQDLFSGLSINFDGPYALGDWLTIHSDQFPENKYGRVTGITWRSTFMQLEDGTRLMVPNRMVTSNPVTNHSRPPGPKRLSVEIPVDYFVLADQQLNYGYLGGNTGPVFDLTPVWSLHLAGGVAGAVFDERPYYGEFTGLAAVEGGFGAERQNIQIRVQYSDISGVYLPPPTTEVDPGRYTDYGGDIGYYQNVGTDTVLGADVVLRHRDYRDIIAGQRHREDYVAPGADVTFKNLLSGQTDVRFDYRYRNNDSNDPIRRYQDHVLTVSLSKRF